MPTLSGNTSTSAVGTAYTVPYKIKSIILVNKTGGAIDVNVSILYGSTNVWITPLNKSLAAGEIYTDDKEIMVLAEQQIYILVSGSCDYHISIE